MTSEKQSMQEVIDFDKQRIEELEATCKQISRKTEERSSNWEGSLLPENMMEEIKKLKKENTILKQELENKFDKDKVIMKTKLEDAVREKQLLEESH